MSIKSVLWSGFATQKQRHRTVVQVCIVLFVIIATRYIYHCHSPNKTLQNVQTTYRKTSMSYHFHRCNIEPVPHLSGMLETAQLLSLTNLSFVRFGDADIDIMLGIEKTWQKADPALQNGLLQVLHNKQPTLMIGLPDTFSGCSEHHKRVATYYYQHDVYRMWLLKHVTTDRQYLQTWITTPYVYNEHSPCLLLRDIYQWLRTIWKGKDIIVLRGDNKQEYEHDVYDTARSQKILYAPRYQAFTAYNNLKQALLKEDPNALYILTCGPVSKLLTYDLVLNGRRALDLGHLAKDYNIYVDNQPSENFWVD